MISNDAKYTLEDLAPIRKVIENRKRKRFFLAHPLRMFSAAEEFVTSDASELDDEIEKFKKFEANYGQTLDSTKAYLKIREVVTGVLSCEFTIPEMVKMYSFEGLEARHVQILRDLDMPKMAEIFEAGLGLRPATPKKYSEFTLNQ